MSYPRFVNAVRLVWLLVVVWYELGTFYHHTSSCAWPDQLLTKSLCMSSRRPQLPSQLTYSQLIVDLNLRKSWRAALRRHPDAVVFLGDMMDNGRYAMPDEEYETYFRRFKSIFAASRGLPMYYLPGNHDVGLGASSPKYQFSDNAVERYISHFGPVNQRITLANHTVWLLDAPGLVDEDRERAIAGMSYTQWAEARPDRTIAFVQSPPQSADLEYEIEGARPILFTHVPLFRPEFSSCGPLRERGTLRQGRGLGYQNLLGQSPSQYLLQTIRPAIVFSGDDHDYCEYVHSVLPTDTKRPSPPTSVPEITVKSFSMAMGIRRPGYQLLSLIPPVGSQFNQHQDQDRYVAHRQCLLPDQLGIYLSIYIPLGVLTLIALFASNIRRMVQQRVPASTRFGESISLGSGEDDGTDYDLPPPRGNRRRVTLSSSSLRRALVTFLWSGGGQEVEQRSKASVLRGFGRDFWEAAWAPLLLFVLIALWV